MVYINIKDKLTRSSHFLISFDSDLIRIIVALVMSIEM